ncbi:MAG: dTDP-4-dehydrorhamnose 3,5-epimerase [Pseudomonadota bacterium]
MDAQELKIDGVWLFTPRRFADARGYFVETYTKKKFETHLTGFDFVQDNESLSTEKYTVRGLHYQAPPFAQDKLVRVVSGSAYDVVVDVRRGSPTYGRSVGATLSAKNGVQLLAPKGFLHGFMTLEPNTIVTYKVTDYYDAEADGAVHWASPGLDIDWPVGPDQATVSDKDGMAPQFSEFSTPF